MLVLTRKENEVIVIGEGEDQIRIMVVKTGSSKIQIGVEAPRHVKVLRGELVEKKS